MLSTLLTVFALVALSSAGPYRLNGLSKDKEGSCPAFESDRPCGRYDFLLSDCLGDDWCDGQQKCCFVHGCKKTCVEPFDCPSLDDCDLQCDFGFAEDRDGCDLCECKVCTEVICDLSCPNGFAERDGCPICQCKRSSNEDDDDSHESHERFDSSERHEHTGCPDVDCEFCVYGYETFTDRNGCETCRCKCSEVMCAMYCEYGFQVENGCPVCKCRDAPDTFQHKRCPPLRCAEPCPEGYQEVNGCPTCQCKRLETKKSFSASSVLMASGLCPEIDCFCEFGYQYDQFGCRTCQCLEPAIVSHPCSMIDCEDDEVCQVQDDMAVCVPRVKRCRPVLCKMRCAFGFKTDENGCDVCQCASDPCKNYQCPSGQRCELLPVPCLPESNCAPQPACVDVTECPLVKCSTVCKYGYVYKDGCQTCTCKNPPTACDHVKCGYGQQCEIQKVCDEAQCNPEPVCVAVRTCPGDGPSNGIVGTCIHECDTDADCPHNKSWCCFNGCGRVCHYRMTSYNYIAKLFNRPSY